MDKIALLEDVSFRYGGVTAVDRLDLVVPRGGVFALLGANGAGKTTTMSLMLGLLQPDSGSVLVIDRRPGSMDARRAIGAMLQVSGVPAMLTVAELVELFSGYYPAPMGFARVVELAGLEGLEQRRFGKLSGGQKQRVLFALALCGDPQLLFLDEPTVGLDVGMRRRMWETIRALAAEGRTVVLTTHYLEEADALADRIAVIHKGRLVADGTPAEVKALVGGAHIAVTTALDDAEITALVAPRTLDREGGVTHLDVAAATPALRALLAADATLDVVSVSGVGLDDAFLSLTADTEEAA